MNKFTITIIILLVGLSALVFMASQGDPSANLSDQERADILSVKEDDHVQGNPEADVVLVEYADLECPACAAFHPAVKEVANQYGDEVAVVYRHFPLVSIHNNARTAGWAAEAAANQGQFDEMVDILYTRQSEWSGKVANVALFVSYAEEIGLDMEQYREEVTSDEVKERVASDLDESRMLGLNSTPTFFLQGERLQAANMQEFVAAIEGAIEEANNPVEETATSTATTTTSTTTATSS
jgi:protein-disulfide isomerase